MQLLRLSIEKGGAATSMTALKSEMICCPKKKLEPKHVENTMLWRCIYCGIYSCDREHCFYKNKHWKCMKKHEATHESENITEFQTLRDNDGEFLCRSKLMKHKHTQTEGDRTLFDPS